MKSPFVRDLKPDEIAIAAFLVTTKEVRQKRSGETYLSLVLSDRTGDLECKMWDKVAEVVGAHYRSLNADAVAPDLLTAGIVLHDIGKIYELNYDRSFTYSTEGQLIGHIALGIRMIGEKLRAFPEFPGKLRNLIE